MQSDISPTVEGTLATEWRETGGVRVPQLLSPVELEACRVFYDWILANPSSVARTFHEGEADSYYNDVGQAKGYRPHAEAFFEACPSIRHKVQAFFGPDNQNIWFFGYEVFHKSGGAGRSSAFHQDAAFAPFSGQHLLRLWIPFEPTKKEYCLQVVSRSHRGPLFNPNKVFFVDPASPEAAGISPTTPMFDSEEELRAMPRIPDYLANPEEHDILSWDLDPGDAVAFHLAAVHGNAPVDGLHPERNTLILSFMGDDCLYKPLPIEGLAFFSNAQAYAGLDEGDHFSLVGGSQNIRLRGTGPVPRRGRKQ